MECIVASGTLQIMTHYFANEAPLSMYGQSGVKFRGVRLAFGRGGREPGACSSNPSFYGRLIALETEKGHSKALVARSVVVSAKVGGAVDALVENEPLMELSPGQTQFFHRLPSGLRMEVICQKGSAPDGGQPDSTRAPLLFIHGSFHGAWCWACFWMPYFAARGHDCYAVSLLGQGASDLPSGTDSFSLQSHAGDIAHFIDHNLTAPPVLIGHSFGGLIVQWFFTRTDDNRALERREEVLMKGLDEPYSNIAAAVLVCSTPPTGNGPMVKRFLKRDLLACIQEIREGKYSHVVYAIAILSPVEITLSMAAKMFGSSLSLCRKSFFSPDVPEADVRKYQNALKRSSRCRIIDLQKVNEYLPLPRLSPHAPRVFVLAAENDFIVDQEGAQETAEWYGTQPVVISGSAHDLMLDTPWKKGAEALQFWLDAQSL